MSSSAGTRLLPIALLLAAFPTARAQDAIATPAPAPPKALSARQAQIAADTQRIFELSKQMKAELEKSGKDAVSVSVLREAAEIERLTRTLAERMKAAH